MPFECGYRCSDCGARFSIITEARPSNKARCPSCPMCKNGNESARKTISKSNVVHSKAKSEKNIRDINESRRTPSVIGSNNHNKAIDATAQIVMQDYGMTDINLGSNLRDGDSCVPKLNHELEQKVDQVFAQQPNKVMGMPGASNLNRALMSQINAGHYKNQADPIKRMQDSGTRVPTQVIHEYRPEKPN